MNYNVLTIPPFDKQLKRLVKKYPSLKKEFAELIDSLEKKPVQGKALYNNCFKIRLSIASKRKGKSGGARIITHIQIVENVVFLLSIYDKSGKISISDNEINDLLNYIT